MGISVNWDNDDKQIILVTYHQPWNWEDFETSLAEISTLLRSVPHMVDLIVDVQDGGELPRDALSRFRRMTEKVPPNQKRLVLVGGDAFDKALMHTVQKTTRTTFRELEMHFVTSLQEARDWLK